jgi:ApbE superfamily uncharacterized protein (UPF0280 family)
LKKQAKTQVPFPRASARLLPSARPGALPRLHLQDGPIDIVILADGETPSVEAAYQAATARFATILDTLCAELPLLRSGASLRNPWPNGAVGRRMRAAVEPLVCYGFITPMAAVAGAVAEEVLEALVQAAPLARAAVNNGGDIALYLAPSADITIGMVARPELPRVRGIDLFGSLTVRHEDMVRGLATSGRHGRSFSLGIADAVTVLARTAAEADAAATVIANAIDLPDHPGIIRRPARAMQADSDLGEIRVTCWVPVLTAAEIANALASGLERAEALRAQGSILGAALHLHGESRLTHLPNIEMESAHV